MAKNFPGRGWKFPVEIDEVTGRIKMSDYEDDVLESIKIIIGTVKGERVMLNDFGSEANNFVFQSTSSNTLYSMQSKILEAIKLWEPRVEQVDVDVNYDESEYGKVIIKIDYKIKNIDGEQSLSYPFYMFQS